MGHGDHQRKVLGPFLREPTRSFRFLREPTRSPEHEGLRYSLPDMNEETIRKALNKLEKDKIFDVEFARGRPKGGERTKVYRLKADIQTFDYIFKLYREDKIETVLASNYVDILIQNREIKFLSIYDKIRGELVDENFKQTASKTLLSLPGTYKDYEKSSYDLKDEISKIDSIFDHRFKPELIEPIRILRSFDHLDAIRFYRKIMHEKILDGSVPFLM